MVVLAGSLGPGLQGAAWPHSEAASSGRARAKRARRAHVQRGCHRGAPPSTPLPDRNQLLRPSLHGWGLGLVRARRLRCLAGCGFCEERLNWGTGRRRAKRAMLARGSSGAPAMATTCTCGGVVSRNVGLHNNPRAASLLFPAFVRAICMILAIHFRTAAISIRHVHEMNCPASSQARSHPSISSTHLLHGGLTDRPCDPERRRPSTASP